MAEIRKLTTGAFDSVIANSEKPVLVIFDADWAGPSKQLAPTLNKIADEHDELVVYRVNTDEEPDLVERFQILTIPSLLPFGGTQNSDGSGDIGDIYAQWPRLTGAPSEAEILKLV
ncbi:thioredoxin family protein [Nocardia sp. NPDC006044]|uniref:thioredoxin family protein n=1 Tax=Nocardia sp. NPDC006044 TaxID=3364306 RepID=UPI0036B80731